MPWLESRQILHTSSGSFAKSSTGQDGFCVGGTNRNENGTEKQLNILVTFHINQSFEFIQVLASLKLIQVAQTVRKEGLVVIEALA